METSQEPLNNLCSKHNRLLGNGTESETARLLSGFDSQDTDEMSGHAMILAIINMACSRDYV